MALSIGLDQLALHQCSQDVLNDQLSQQTLGKKSLWSPPKFEAALSADQPVIPPTSIFEDLQGEGGEPQDNRKDEVHLPSVAQCAVHLQLLESFLLLQEMVLKSNALDHAFSIKPVISYTSASTSYRRVLQPDYTFLTRREKKWPIFVDLAVSRFLTWWGSLGNILGLSDTAESYLHSTAKIEEEYLPPLDVLMVWHSLLLNPETYTKICERRHQGLYNSIKFPWKAIHKAISLKDSSYTKSDTSAAAFSKHTGLDYDLFGYLANFKQFSPAVTEVISKWANSKLQKSDLKKALEAEPGMAPDQKCFLKTCSIAIYELPELVSTLRSAVLRQVTFVRQMGKHAWVRSPALHGTLTRAIDRYGKYLELFKKYPRTLLVPTLDVDLVWHTHLCAPQQYRHATASVAGRFINHDDTIATDALAGGLLRTKNLFRVRFGEEYVRCLCWDCEALRSALEVKVLQGAREVDYEAIAERVSLDVAYHRAVEIARRGKKPLPARPA